MKKLFRINRDGTVLLYIVAAILIAGTLGAAIASLTITSTLGELSYNSSDQARHLAQSGLDYAESALEAEDEDLKAQFRADNINDTVFSLDIGEFRLTVLQDDTLPTLYDITSEGRVQVGTLNEAGFLVAGETWVNIYFSDHNIDVTIFWPGTGYIVPENTPESPGYTYNDYEDNNLVLYGYQGRQLVTITANETLRYSNLHDSLGTTYVWGSGGLIETNDQLEFTFPHDPAYTELTIHFTSFNTGDRARIRFYTNGSNAGGDNLDINDITNSSATVTSNQPFNRFTIESRSGEFGLSGIKIKAE
ncbi:MAG: hypothetical protein K9J85_00030 [Desulfobacteraceae bacterium]|nr:hypothetical protein [Desulfobacteraceae bacterium]